MLVGVGTIIVGTGVAVGIWVGVGIGVDVDKGALTCKGCPLPFDSPSPVASTKVITTATTATIPAAPAHLAHPENLPTFPFPDFGGGCGGDEGGPEIAG